MNLGRCNSDKCHCPRCRQARQALDQAEKIIDARFDRARRAAHERWRASSWIWFHGRLGFQRMDKRSRRKFGPIYRTPGERDWQSRHGTITNPFDAPTEKRLVRCKDCSWLHRPGECLKYAGRPMPPAMTEEAYLSAKEMSDWWLAHNWGKPCKAIAGHVHPTASQKPVTYTLNLSQWGKPHNPEKPMLTDLALSILFRIANREALSLAGTSGYCDAVSELSNKKLIEFRNSGTHITTRGEVLMTAIRKLPLPERVENWAMPKS